ncbi:hypothetical protein [Pseudochryseolinea flava]|nr:hypothetical protein [Pseudochryseolinea flava]
MTPFDKTTITAKFTEYFEHLMNNEYEKALGFVYAPLFNFIGKKEMVDGMKKANTGDTTTMLSELIVKSVKPILQSDKETYGLLDYSFQISIHCPPDTRPAESGDDEDEAQNMSALDFTDKILMAKYGEDNVSTDRLNNTITAHVTNQSYCIFDPESNDWKFLEKKSAMLPLLKNLIPKAIDAEKKLQELS